jgi:hypothetical protein
MLKLEKDATDKVFYHVDSLVNVRATFSSRSTTPLLPYPMTELRASVPCSNIDGGGAGGGVLSKRTVGLLVCCLNPVDSLDEN